MTLMAERMDQRTDDHSTASSNQIVQGRGVTDVQALDHLVRPNTAPQFPHKVFAVGTDLGNHDDLAT